MKKILFLLSVLIFAGCSAVQENQYKAAKYFIESQFDFFKLNSLEKAKKTFAHDAVLIGTDKAEFFKGWSQIEPSIAGQLAAIKNPKFKTRDLTILLSNDGKMASYTQVVDFSYELNGEPGEIKDVRNSGVIKNDHGVWKIAQIHWSVGVQGQVVEYEM